MNKNRMQRADSRRQHAAYSQLYRVYSLFSAHFIPAVLCLLFTAFCYLPSYSQLLTPLSNELNRRIEYKMTSYNLPFFTVWKPFYDNQLMGNAREDSLYLLSDIPGTDKTWMERKLFQESLVQVDSGSYYLFADPLFEFGLGKDNLNRKTMINTRGFRAGGRLGKYFAFATSFYEDQAIFNTALDSIFRRSRIIPGQGKGRINGNTWDYAHSSGYISFTPFSKLNIQFGHGKQFIGDGYRSLLLSDVSFNYPYFRATYQYKNMMYSWMLASTQNIAIAVSSDRDEEPYVRETLSVHVLSLNILKHLQFSVIECELYNNPDTFGRWKADFNLFNPIMLPVNRGTAVHSIWGINTKIIVHPHLWIYQQLILDDLFGNSPVRAGYQVGMKYFDVFGLKGLYLQAEYNREKPFIYTSKNKSIIWSHFGEPLAHAYGNNFEEGIVRMSYSYKRWLFNSNTNYAKQIDNQIFLGDYSSNGIPYFTNGKKLFLQSFVLSWYVNPKTLMNFSLGYQIRNEDLDGKMKNQGYINFSFRTSLMNLYYDL